MNFARIPGHQEIIARLIRSVKEQRVSHAQLFTGPEGCGSLALALAFAQFISCENRQEADSCGKCKSCLKYEKMIHPDFHFVYPVIKKKNSTEEPVSDDYLPQWREYMGQSPFRSINDWFDKIGSEETGQGMIYTAESSEIIRKLSLKPYESDFKIMIIWLPERMNQTSANKLLKMIEEPPEKTLFLMVSDEPDKILPTIMSRCQMVKIPAFKSDEVTSYLRSTYGATFKEADEIARLARGNILRAINLIEKDEATKHNLEHFRTLMRNAWKRDVAAHIEWADKMASAGRETQKNFLDYSLRLLRENLMLSLNQVQNQLVFLSDEEALFSEKFHPYITLSNCIQIADEFNLAAMHIEANGYARLVFLDLALKVTKVIR
ncbi:MAG: DNA polymerase III subunit delta' [Bacteroidales bacterium]